MKLPQPKDGPLLRHHLKCVLERAVDRVVARLRKDLPDESGSVIFFVDMRKVP